MAIIKKSKEIDRKKKEILNQIGDLKDEYDDLSLINRRLANEKRKGVKMEFTVKELMEKKKDLLHIIKKEGEASFWKALKSVSKESTGKEKK